MPNKVLSRWLVAAFVFATLPPASATQESASGAHATALVEAMAEFLENAEQLSFTATSVHTAKMADGIPFTLASETRAAVRRPDRFWVDVRSEQVHKRFLYDGEQLTIHHLMANLYAVMDAPTTIDSTLARMEEGLDIFVPLADLIAADAGQRIMEGVEEITYLGLDDIDGVSCHHVFARQADLEWEVWIEDGHVLVPRKLVLDFENDEGSPTFTTLLSDWNFSPHLPDAVFDQSPPLDARQIELRAPASDSNP